MTRSDPTPIALLCLTLGLGGCGGARTTASTTPPAGDTHAADGGEEREELPLDAPHLVPGTGVTLRAPRGSEPTPFGAGFVHRARRIQMLVAAAQGGPEVLAAFRHGLENDAEPESTEEVELAGRPTTLHVDRQQASEEQWIERVWAIVTEGDRAFVVAGAYDASRSERLRALVRASVLSASWDATAPLDPETAVGFRLHAPEGLEVDRSTTSSVTYGRPGAMMPPVVGSPTLFLIAVPAMVPLAQRDEACEPILFQAGPVPDDHVRTRGRIETEEVEGCEVTGWQEREAEEGAEASQLATYAAVVYAGDQTFLVAGVVAEAERDSWLPRFAEAARTVSAAR
ncbi:MAG: hypothetical protein K1X94_04110 [Sandaracinaceae bacterium]|nr:hypothetical protein [Sandaracinaceae bacterium]